MALGSGEKEMSKSEVACKRKLGKTIVAKRKISKGEVISSNDVVVKVLMLYIYFPYSAFLKPNNTYKTDVAPWCYYVDWLNWVRWISGLAEL